MIVCFINGQTAYPLTSEAIKLTQENPYIKDSGEYTYEISFPMSIPENIDVFGNVQRVDVKKTRTSFDNCRLMIDNRPIMSGKGIVTNVTHERVKLQITGGKSRVKYNSTFDNHYIDEIDYGWMFSGRFLADAGLDSRTTLLTSGAELYVDANKTFVGRKNIAVFNPSYDETNTIAVNRKRNVNRIILTNSGPAQADICCMDRLAIQPNLIFILHTALAKEGFSVTRNDFDCEPWSRLYIANVYQTERINEALPHWSLYYLMDEIAKLFGVSFVFDEHTRTVEIIRKNEILSENVVEYEIEDGFSADYDEDGLSSNFTDNLAYNLSDSSERSWKEEISLSTINSFEHKSCADMAELISIANVMSDRQKRSTIFEIRRNFYTYILDTTSSRQVGDGEAIEQEGLTLSRIGIFRPLVQDDESEETSELHIIPVAMAWEQADEESAQSASILVPSLPNPRGEDESELTEDSDGQYYLSVQNSLEGKEDKRQQNKNSGDMCLFFQVTHDAWGYNLPSAYTDWTSVPKVGMRGIDDTTEIGSMALESIHSMLGCRIDKNFTISVRFISDRLPSPRDIYMFRNKRYICAKVESDISNGRLSNVHKGYFYEITE